MNRDTMMEHWAALAAARGDLGFLLEVERRRVVAWSSSLADQAGLRRWAPGLEARLEQVSAPAYVAHAQHTAALVVQGARAQSFYVAAAAVQASRVYSLGFGLVAMEQQACPTGDGLADLRAYFQVDEADSQVLVVALEAGNRQERVQLSEVADKEGVSLRTVQRRLRGLVASGIVVATRARRGVWLEVPKGVAWSASSRRVFPDA